MGFFDIMKKPAEVEKPRIETTGPPTNKVIMMRRQGLTNNQIIQALQNEGHSTTDIFDAMNQADLKGGVEMPSQQQPSGPPFGPMPEQMMSPPGASFGPEGIQPFPAPETSGGVSERIEEIAEAIIDEKWNEIVKSINKIADWKESTEARIIRLEQQIEDLKNSFDQLHKGILGKIGEYDKNLTNISVEIDAMDKVFQKVLPIMTENVKELSRITEDMKRR